MTTPDERGPEKNTGALRRRLAMRGEDGEHTPRQQPTPAPAPIAGSVDNLRARFASRTRPPDYQPPTYEEAFRQSTLHAGQIEQQRRQQARDEFYREMAELKEQQQRREDELHSLSSGDELEYDYQLQQFILGPGQSRLWNVLENYNTYRLMDCPNMLQDQIREYVQNLDKVPDAILEMVAEQLSIEQREIIDKNQPKLKDHPTFADLARRCLTALDATKVLNKFLESLKPPKPSIRRVIL